MIFGFGRSPGITIPRHAVVADGDAIAGLHAASFDRPWGQIEFERLLASENVVCHVATGHRGTITGFSLSRRAADEAELLSIAVHPAERGRGIAATLLRAQSEHLALERIRAYFLEVEEENAAARALYSRLGFTEVSRRAAYYRKADGSAATALVMRKGLP